MLSWPPQCAPSPLSFQRGLGAEAAVGSPWISGTALWSSLALLPDTHALVHPLPLPVLEERYRQKYLYMVLSSASHGRNLKTWRYREASEYQTLKTLDMQDGGGGDPDIPNQ